MFEINVKWICNMLEPCHITRMCNAIMKSQNKKREKRIIDCSLLIVFNPDENMSAFGFWTFFSILLFINNKITGFIKTIPFRWTLNVYDGGCSLCRMVIDCTCLDCYFCCCLFDKLPSPMAMPSHNLLSCCHFSCMQIHFVYHMRNWLQIT